MADVDMTDAPTAGAATKKGDVAEGKMVEGKKRFEVKKVMPRNPTAEQLVGFENVD